MNTSMKDPMTSSMKLILPLTGILAVLLMLGGFAPVRADDADNEFGLGMTDIGPEANELLRKAFWENAESMFSDATVLLSPDQAAKGDAKVWMEMCSEFNDKFDASVADAKDSTREYLSGSWTGDFPDDWKKMIRKGKEFILHLSSVGYAAYEKWGTFAVWMKEYDADAKAMGDKIEKIQEDFKDLNDQFGNASIAAGDNTMSKKDKLKKLKDILKNVQSLEKSTIPNSLDIMEKYRDMVKKRTEDSDRKPDTVKKVMEDAVTNVGKTAESAAAFFPAAKSFAEEWTKNAKQLSDDYKKSYDAFVKATKPIMGDIPEIWSGMTQFRDWEFDEFATKMQELRKKVELEIVRVEGIKTVD